MPCTKCQADFNVFNWKLKCGECRHKYCNKCLDKKEGVLYCKKCMILLRRPPDSEQLMELKPKDLQDYLNKHNISTYGLVEKQELVDLICTRHIPVKSRRGVDKLMANLPGSVPNLSRPSLFDDFFNDIDSISSNRSQGCAGSTSSPPPRPPQPIFVPTTPIFVPTAPIPTDTSSGAAASGVISNDETNNKSDIDQSSSPIVRKYPSLSDYDTVEDLGNVSARDLKIILTINRVNYKGCVEKAELLEKVERLWIDNIRNKNEDLPEELDNLCKLCMDAPLDCVLLECGHIATCINCGKKLAECPICRQYVTRVVRTFKA